MTTRWRVIRQDDNGNEYLVADARTQAEALVIMRAFEARAHKQTYYVVEATAGKRPSEP